MLQHLANFVYGLGIGIANVIPGVSGGTMALIFGIYERVIGAASQGVRAGLLLLKTDFAGFLSRLRQMPWMFLGPLTLGILAAPFLGASLLSDLLERYPEVMRGLFFGLIVGSLPIPWLRIGNRGARTWILIVLAAAAAWMLSGLPTRADADPGMLMVFGSAALAISAMVLPGVSGAYLLLILGIYQATLNALESFDVVFISVFAAGAGVGLAAFTVLLNWLLKHRHDATMAVLVGLMAGSLRALWPWLSTESEVLMPGSGDAVLPVVAAGVLGLLLTGVLTWWELSRSGSEGKQPVPEAG
ncbi:MAG: DUF368 domain-containing protein [Rhodothermales bacterium]|nr:DUF368 domain-containing protein [Rhodothermales bacterium]MBO6779120.1 DUF368 domain-containing protein [Rhodothermales bacterium]